MKTYHLYTDHHFQLILKKLDSDNISGHMEFFPVNDNLFIPFQGICNKISDTNFDFFFSIDWKSSEEKKCYTIFTGCLAFNNLDIIQFNLRWSLNCEFTKKNTYGCCSFSNRSPFETMNNIKTDLPCPTELLEQT